MLAMKPSDDEHDKAEGWRIRSPEIGAPANVIRRHTAHTGAMVDKVVSRMRGAVAAKVGENRNVAPSPPIVDVPELERELLRAKDQLEALVRNRSGVEDSAKRAQLIKAAESRVTAIEAALR